MSQEPNPFEDFEEQTKSVHWTDVHTRLVMPGLEVTVYPDGHSTLKAPNVRLYFTKEQTEGMTRFLQEHVKVEPLPPPDESMFKDFKPNKVEE